MLVLQMALGDEYAKRMEYGIRGTSEYCQHHSYNHLMYRELPFQPAKERPPAWYKLLLIQHVIKENLGKEEWLFWLDNDTMIMDHRIKAESFVLNETKNFVFSTDPTSRICTGCWFLKVNELSIQRCDEWYNGPTIRRLWEQHSVDTLLRKEEFAMRPTLSGMLKFPQPLSPHFYRDGYHWIKHFAGRDKKGMDISNLLKRAYQQVKV